MDNQKDSLLSLITIADGENWSQQRDSGWKADEDVDVCDWDGIKCNNGVVYEINLENTNLVTTIPKNLGDLSSLTHLYLASNTLEGKIPKEVTQLSKLVHIDLSMNELTGKFPIFASTDLRVINLSYNKLSGGLPANTKDTGGDKLEILDIKYNHIGGAIPDSIGEISSSLRELDLSNNKLNGPIPNSLGDLLRLEGLFLSNNQLNGPIPASLTKTSLALSQIFLHGNNLSGTLPVTLADLPNLKNLFIGGNKITGTVPEDLCALNLNKILFQISDPFPVQGRENDFDHNYKDDMGLTVDDLGHSVNILVEGIDIPVEVPVVQEDEAKGETEGRLRRKAEEDIQVTVRDGCNSIACPAGYHSIEIGKEGVFPCERCYHDYLNPYIGASSCFLIDQFEVMANFYNLANGKKWVGDYGSWRSKDPVCLWEGISCNKVGDIVSVVLPNSNLDGAIYPNVGLLRHLEMLDLSDNSLKGIVPTELHFAPLVELYLSGNMLEGFVPRTLCEKAGVNGNGEGGEFSCERIMCSAGKSSATGRAEERSKCTACPNESMYLGNKDCVASLSESAPLSSSSENTSGIPHNVIIAVESTLSALVIVSVLIMLARFHKKKRDEKPHDVKDGGSTDPETEIPPVDNLKDKLQSGTFPGTIPASVTEQVNVWSSPRDIWITEKGVLNNGKDSTNKVSIHLLEVG